jgi:DNA-directed RNA polymerase subunit RPC12/RpoP
MADQMPNFWLDVGDQGAMSRIVVEMLAAVSTYPGVYRCSECGETYFPPGGRKPKEGNDNYCPVCSEGRDVASKRNWARRNRAKDKGRRTGDSITQRKKKGERDGQTRKR